MAKKFFEQIISMVSSQPHDSDAYRDSSGLTGVARYLERKAAAAAEIEAAEAAENEAQLTGVARYLEKRAALLEESVEEQEEESSAELSGVAKYLARKGESKPEQAKVSKKKLSGVAKYMAEHDNAPAKKAKTPAEKVKAKPADKKKKKPKAEKKRAAKSSGMINLSEDVTQCQAGTSSGKRCSRTTKLVKIQRTINKQKYKFTVCSQHDIDSFKPYPPILE